MQLFWGVLQIYFGNLLIFGEKYFITVKVLNLDLTVANIRRHMVGSESEPESGVQAIVGKIIYSF